MNKKELIEAMIEGVKEKEEDVKKDLKKQLEKILLNYTKVSKGKAKKIIETVVDYPVEKLSIDAEDLPDIDDATLKRMNKCINNTH